MHDTQAAAGGAPVVVSDRIFAGDFMYAFCSGEDVRTYRALGVAGSGATYRSLAQGAPPAGTVVLTTADEQLAGALKLEEVSVTHPDDWGQPQVRPMYRIWRVEPS